VFDIGNLEKRYIGESMYGIAPIENLPWRLWVHWQRRELGDHDISKVLQKYFCIFKHLGTI
jgi:hypothetical protein